MQKLFKQYHPSKMNTDFSLALAQAICKALSKSFPDDAYFSRQVVHLTTIINAIEVLQGRSMGNDLTQTLADLDLQRDNLTVGMHYEVESKIKMKAFSPEKGVAAEAIQLVFDTTVVDVRDSLDSETNQINARIRKLDTPVVRAHFETIGLTEILDHYIRIQDTFQEVSSEKDALESIKLRGTVREQCVALHAHMNYVLTYLTAQTLDFPETYAKVSSEIDESINRISALLKSSETRKMTEES